MSRKPITRLILKQIVKRRARVIRTLTAFDRRFLFDHHAYGIERAVVALIFGRDSGGNRLIAFEAAGRIEVFALFAGMEVEPALRTLPDGIREILQQRATFSAAGDGPGSWHVDRPRPERILSFGGRRLLRISLSFRSRAGILVSALPILAVGQKTPPEKRLMLRFWRVPHKRLFRATPGTCWGKPDVTARPDPSTSLRAGSRGVLRSAQGAVNCLSQIRVLPSDKQRNGGGRVCRIVMATVSYGSWRVSEWEQWSVYCMRRSPAMKHAMPFAPRRKKAASGRGRKLAGHANRRVTGWVADAMCSTSRKSSSAPLTRLAVRPITRRPRRAQNRPSNI